MAILKQTMIILPFNLSFPIFLGEDKLKGNIITVTDKFLSTQNPVFLKLVIEASCHTMNMRKHICSHVL